MAGKVPHDNPERRERLLGYLRENPEATRVDVIRAGYGPDLFDIYTGNMKRAMRDAGVGNAHYLGYTIISTRIDRYGLKIIISGEVDVSGALRMFEEAIDRRLKDEGIELDLIYGRSEDCITIRVANDPAKGRNFLQALRKAMTV